MNSTSCSNCKRRPNITILLASHADVAGRDKVNNSTFVSYLIIYTGHCPPTPVHSSVKITNHSFRHGTPHFWNKLHSTLRVPNQSGASSPSSSPPLFFDPGPVVDILMSFSTLVLKPSLSQNLFLRSHLSLPKADLEF